MSTRALISYIPTVDVEVQFDPKLLPARIHDWIRRRSDRRKVDDALKVAQENSRLLVLKKGKTYSIYCHNDGGLDGVGSTLFNFFSREEQVANLIAAGDCSSVSGIIAPYTSLGESFKSPFEKDWGGWIALGGYDYAYRWSRPNEWEYCSVPHLLDDEFVRSVTCSQLLGAVMDKRERTC
jgi:hypothetical protein